LGSAAKWLTTPAITWVALCGMGGAPTTRDPVLFRYSASHLQCARFGETSTGTLEAETGGRRRRETIGRSGVWNFRAAAVAGEIALEGWYDSLAVWRESPEGKLVPDTDGLIGGRYRGRLSPSGEYRSEGVPFVPDEVAEVADMRGAAGDLLPLLSPAGLDVGQVWRDSAGLEIRRLPDSTAGTRVVLRLLLHARTSLHQARLPGDSSSIETQQMSVENGRVSWDAAAGLLHRERHIVVETTVPAGGPIRWPVRSRLVQDVTLSRLASDRPAPGSCS